MRYELMRPGQIREAIARRTPVVLPLGVLEYHSEHLPVGMDTLAVERALWEYEKEGVTYQSRQGLKMRKVLLVLLILTK